LRGVHLASYRSFPTSASPGRAVGAAAVAIVAGLVVGIGTQVLQGVLPDSWGVLANSGVVWALGAFALGTLMPSVRAAALGGTTTMVLASLSYYWAVDWFGESARRGAAP